MYRVMPRTFEVSCCRLWMISLTVLLRWSRGLRLIRKRPLLSVTLLPSTPMNDERLTTSGSLSTAAASACCRSAMAA